MLLIGLNETVFHSDDKKQSMKLVSIRLNPELIDIKPYLDLIVRTEQR